MKLNIIVIPNAKTPLILRLEENAYKVKVNAPAVAGKANRRLIEMLSDHFDVPRSSVRIVRGLSSKNKIVEILP